MVGVADAIIEARQLLEATWIDKATSASNASSYDFGDWTATKNGILVVGACSSQDDVFSSISIGGVAASLGPQDGSGNARCTMARRTVAAGAHNITVNFAGSQTFCAIGVWLLTGAVASPGNGANGQSAGVDVSTDPMTVTKGGIILLCSTHNNTNGTSWSDAAEEDEVNVESNNCAWASLVAAAAGTHDETASWSSTTSGAIAGRTWR